MNAIEERINVLGGKRAFEVSLLRILLRKPDPKGVVCMKFFREHRRPHVHERVTKIRALDAQIVHLRGRLRWRLELSPHEVAR